MPAEREVLQRIADLANGYVQPPNDLDVLQHIHDLASDASAAMPDGLASQPHVSGLDEPCPTCGRRSGDHTVREWADCLGRPTTDLPFKEISPDLAAAAAENLRRSFDLDGDLIVADHVVVRAVTLDGATGPVSLRLPALMHEFQVGVGGQAPVTVAKVLFTGDSQTVRGYGRLVRDSANGAVNAAERGS